MRFNRVLNLPELIKKKSFFLLGPRSTGKTTLIKTQLSNRSCYINLLEGDKYLRFSAETEAFRSHVLAQKEKYIIVDEIQKIPALLDEVHDLIESHQYRFLLTGSSARKLKRGHANLLAGRAWIAHIFPLVFSELDAQFKLEHQLRYGSLPQVFTSAEPNEELKAYAQTYLYEEVQAEGLVRKIPQFSRFLKFAALNFGNLLNYAQLSNDTGVAASTLKEHFQILEDTLIGFTLPPWEQSKTRKAIGTAKFYFFDNGVTHTLSGTKTIDRNSDLYGRSFEQLLINEVRAYLSYRRKDDELSFWRTKHNDEVDLLIDTHTALEFRSTKKISTKDVKGLQRLKEEKKFKKYYLVSNDPIKSSQNGIIAIHYLEFLKQLWSDELF